MELQSLMEEQVARKEAASRLFLHREWIIRSLTKRKVFTSYSDRVEEGLRIVRRLDQDRLKNIGDWAPICVDPAPLEAKWNHTVADMLCAKPNDQIWCTYRNWFDEEPNKI